MKDIQNMVIGNRTGLDVLNKRIPSGHMENVLAA